MGSTYNFNGELMNTVLDSFKEAGTAGVSKQQLETAQSVLHALLPPPSVLCGVCVLWVLCNAL